MPSNIGFATLQVIPSLKGLDRKIGGQLDGPLGAAGARAGDNASSKFKHRFSSGLKVAGLAAGAALTSGLTGAIAILGVGAKEASDASKGIEQLKAGIKSTGNVANVSVPQMEGLATSIQNFSGQTDDSIVASEQLLLTFTNIQNAAGKGNDIFNQATLATANLAAKMGGDASASAIQLGKALNDPVKGITALTRVGVSFTQGQKDQIKALVATGDVMGAQKIILKELNTEFGGAAKAAGQSVPGQLARAKRSFEDLSQGIVETLLPIALPAVEKLTAGLKILAPIAAQVAQKVVAGLSSLAGKIDFSGLFSTIGEAVKSVLPSLQQFGAQLVDLFVNHLVPLFVKFSQVVVPVVVDIGKKLATIFTKAIVPAFKELVDFASTKVIPVVERIADALSGFLGFLAKHQGAVKNFAKVALGLLVARFAALKINAAVVGIKKFGSEIASNVKSVQAFARSLARGVATSASFAKSALRGALNIGRQTVAFVAQKVAMLAAAVAQKAMAAAQWLLNAAMTANPVGLIVAGIAALAAGVVLAYQHFKPFRDIVDAVGRVFVGIFNFIKGHWPLLLVILTGPFGAAFLLIKSNWSKITGIFAGVFNWLKGHWPLLLAILTGPIGAAVLIIVKNWDKITNAFRVVKDFIGARVTDIVNFITGIPGRIAGVVSDMFGGIRTAFASVYGWIRERIDTLVGWFVQLPARLLRVGSGIFDFLGDAMRNVLNFIIRIWNNTIGKLSFKIPGWVPFLGGKEFKGPKISELAGGGVITSPTLAMLGETGRARPEIVAPARMLSEIFAAELAKFGGRGVHIDNVYPRDANDFARELRAVVRRERQLSTL